ADPELEPVRGREPLKRAHDKVRAIARELQLGRDRKRAGLHDLDLQLERQRGREHVEPGAEVRRRGGDADQSPPREAHGESPPADSPKTARSIAPISGSHGITPPPCWRSTCASAVSGSLRPWPVSTHAIRRAPSAPCASRPATPVADAGSQNTPSSAARNRYADRICSSLTAAIIPCEEVTASIACSQRAGLPIRIAEATVSGCSTGR